MTGMTHLPSMRASELVLRSRELLAAVSDFQRGLPLHVRLFQREHSSLLLPKLLQHDFRLVLDGVLPNLAVLAGDLQLLRLLYALSRRPAQQYQRDSELRFTGVARCAVLCHRVEVLECLAQLTKRDPDWKWEVGLLRMALRYSVCPQTDVRANLKVLDWIYTNLPDERASLEVSDIAVYARRGKLEVVQWFIEHGYEVTRTAVESAVHGRKLHVLQYLYAHSEHRCSREVVEDVARNGYVDIVKLLVENAEDESSCRTALSCAARNGHLGVVRLLVESEISHDAPHVLDQAAENGHLAVVEYLHEHFHDSEEVACTTAAMDGAAANGHLETVEFLHEHRSEGCTTAAMDSAARNGHLGVVRFLHEKRSEGCTIDAMNGAAKQKHLGVLVFLHENRAEGCTAEALEVAVANRDFDTLRFLCAHRPESNIAAAMVNVALARMCSDLSTARALFERRRPERSLCGALRTIDEDLIMTLHAYMRPEDSSYDTLWMAAVAGNSKLTQFLCERRAREPASLLLLAVTKADAFVVQAICSFFPTSELEVARDVARSEKRLEIVECLESAILVSNASHDALTLTRCCE